MAIAIPPGMNHLVAMGRRASAADFEGLLLVGWTCVVLSALDRRGDIASSVDELILLKISPQLIQHCRMSSAFRLFPHHHGQEEEGGTAANGNRTREGPRSAYWRGSHQSCRYHRATTLMAWWRTPLATVRYCGEAPGRRSSKGRKYRPYGRRCRAPISSHVAAPTTGAGQRGRGTQGSTRSGKGDPAADSRTPRRHPLHYTYSYYLDYYIWHLTSASSRWHRHRRGLRSGPGRESRLSRGKSGAEVSREGEKEESTDLHVLHVLFIEIYHIGNNPLEI
jgi:hypothetical protein